MGDLLKFPLADGAVLWVSLNSEIIGDPANATTGTVEAGRDPVALLEERIYLAQQSLDRALEPIASASKTVLQAFKVAAPREIAIEFGVELDAEVGAVLAKSGGSCHLNVKLSWGADSVDDPAVTQPGP